MARTGCSLHKSSWSSCTRARVCKELSRGALHTPHESRTYNVTVQEPAPVLHTQLSHQHTDRRLTKVNTKVPKKSVDGGHTMPPCPTWLGSVLPCVPPARQPPAHPPAALLATRGDTGHLLASEAATAAALRSSLMPRSTTDPAPPVTAAAGSVMRSFTGGNLTRVQRRYM